MKNILLGLLFICTVTDASKSNLPESKTSPQKSAATTQTVTANDLLQMHHYFKSTYYPIIEGLREKSRTNRGNILDAYSGDPFLKRVHDGGHATFTHKILPLTFGVIAHGNGDISVRERQGHHATLQTYVNVIKIFFQSILNVDEAVAARNTMSAAEWKQVYEAKLNEATAAFNAMSSAAWDQLIKAQEAAFEEYSRD
ncbi:MAG: hypothetical protein I8H80_01005 [Alphaproteobacteria bacterium]|nr:hypothetical protein [Alphaproteobacteria bacterium]